MKIIQSAISMAKNRNFHGKSKHIAIKYHFVREQVSNGTIELKCCKTNNMIADIMTKGLTGECFGKLRTLIGLETTTTNHAGSSEKEC